MMGEYGAQFWKKLVEIMSALTTSQGSDGMLTDQQMSRLLER